MTYTADKLKAAFLISCFSALFSGSTATQAQQDASDYMENVKLSNVRVEEVNHLMRKVPGILGTVTNEGDRSLRLVKMTVYFLDENGVRVSEDDYPLVFVPRNFDAGDRKPLKPNYVKDFGFAVVDSAPSVWAGEIEYELTEIDFMD